MLFTILGAFIGGFVSYYLAKCLGIGFNRSAGIVRVISMGDVVVFAGILIGGGIGFGYGTSLLLSGKHLFNRLNPDRG
jgi:hypothetical protein